MTKSLPPKSLVLYADDDPDDIEFVEEAFLKYTPNVELRCFPDGLELLGYIQDLPSFEPLPCLIILDINMPGMNGKEVLKQIRQLENFREVPVVLFTTSTLPSEAAFARSFDAGFVNKPLHRNQIEQLVEYILQNCNDDLKKRFGGKGSNSSNN
jgi:CheY-like chemotaxis protein